MTKIITKSELKQLINETVENAIDKIINLNERDNSDVSDNSLLEMAKLNLKDDETSIFPCNRYRVWVQGENSPHKPPHLHIKDYQDGWEVKVFIQNGEIWKVLYPGKRGTVDKNAYKDIVKKLKHWFTLPTKMPGRVGTNQETAMFEWDACNEE